MKLSELKQRVYSAWECLSDFNDALIQQENFLQEVRAFGDLRRKLTWQTYGDSVYGSGQDAFETSGSKATYWKTKLKRLS